ncbi:FecR domain-containing protein [Methylobacterium planeticum]|uniref:FecR domain-containing protein n=1 Tax=Methylobacterium planeticum TaxID=2615211 RepID=A0A6N6MPJ6_9HYPH|nr:FecR domain-containing protein [Methylobacterium planeticum]KAB1072436.1 FecR domain-containing protein [Methylobacterium planeticum]
MLDVVPGRSGRTGPLRITAAAAVLAIAALGSGAAEAQSRGCTVTPYTDPPRQVLSCADGLTVSAETGTAYKLVDRNHDGRPESAEVTSRGLLIDVPPRRGGFQILTPHAVASVRGTVWAVDVSAQKTAVFVRAGSVAVARPGGPAVTLRAGEGVDVEAGGNSLHVQRWSPERAAGLLARFGR